MSDGLLFGFIAGLILICLSKKIKYFLHSTFILLKSFLLSQKHKFISDKLSLIDSSRAWMYELRDETYDPHTFSFSMTNICLIEIRKSLLFVFQPLTEPNHKLNDRELYSQVIFNQVEIYNLNKATIGLLPANMIRSKYWSKKCPIVLRNILYIGKKNIQTLSTDISIPLYKMNEKNLRKTLLFFTRTRPSKEDWFYRFVNASQLDSWRKEIHYRLEQDNIIHDQNKDRIKDVEIHSWSNSKRQYCEQWLMKQNLMNDEEKRIDIEKHEKTSFNYDKNTNGTDISDTSKTSFQTDPNQFQHKLNPLLFFVLKYLQKMPYDTKESRAVNPITLMNIFAARCFLDIFDNEQYLARIEIFIQKQLRKINIPFIERITMTNLNLGDRLPEIKDIFKPWIDEHGLWSHIKISFDGRLQLTLAGKLKLIRKNRPIGQISRQNPSVSHLNDLEETIFPKSDPVKKAWHRHLWPPSHWFRHRKSNHTFRNKNNSYLKTIRPKLSKTTIVIKLEVNNLNGILVFNIPPIPSDRIWISFLNMPQMEFSATPHLGEFRVPFYKIKDKLEKKLRQIFRRYLVMPNMKDLIIPTVHDHLSQVGIIKTIPSEMKTLRE